MGFKSHLMIYSHGFRDICGNKHVKANMRHESVRVAVFCVFFGLVLALIVGLARFLLLVLELNLVFKQLIPDYYPRRRWRHVTGWILPEIESRWGRDFLHSSRLALRSTQPRVQWVPGLTRGLSGRGVALTTHLSPRLKKE